MNETPTVRTVRCPQCGASVRWEAASRYRPFCSERCKLIDIGAWASGAYRISGDADLEADDDAVPPTVGPDA